LKICPECKTENKFDGAQFCKKCGATLAETNNIPAENNSDFNDDLEFEVTETIEPDAPQLFGNGPSKKKKTDEESLEIEDNANLLGDDQIDVPSESEISTDRLALNDTEPQKPEITDPVKPDRIEKADSFMVDWGSTSESGEKKDNSPQDEEKPESADNTPSAQEFSRKRLEIETEKNMQSQSDRPALHKVPNFNSSNIDAPQTSESQITKSSRVRGVAYFYRNIIQLAGNPFLHENDDIVFKNKPYRLKPYRISKKAKFIGIAAMFVLLSIIIGSQIIGPALPGYGQIVGIVLDESGQPYLGGASIYIPELDKSITSNALGFFRFNNVPTGSYELVYRLGDYLEGRENITVTPGSISMRSFGDYETSEKSYNYTVQPEITGQKAVLPSNEAVKKTTKSGKKKPAATKKSSSGYGKIKLVANVEGAKFVVDSKTLGAGNNTYTRIKSGKRKIQVSKPGYTEYTEIVTVSKNKTKTVKANLSRKVTDSDETLTANDYFILGNDAFAAKKYESAINEYTRAIELSPNHIDAYSKRAQAYAAIGHNEKSASDYIRIGEIYSFRNQNGLAISQFTSALKYSPDNKTALVGRAGARMDKGEYRSALIDYTSALEIDDRFYPARFGAGIAEFKLGDNKSAEKHFKKAKKINDSDPKLYHYLMLNYLDSDNIKQVKKTYGQFKNVVRPDELAEFKSSSRFAPIIRLIDEDDL